MTTRETIRYMLAVCGLWLLTYWDRILVAVVALVVVVWILGR